MWNQQTIRQPPRTNSNKQKEFRCSAFLWAKKKKDLNSSSFDNDWNAPYLFCWRVFVSFCLDGWLSVSQSLVLISCLSTAFLVALLSSWSGKLCLVVSGRNLMNCLNDAIWIFVKWFLKFFFCSFEKIWFLNAVRDKKNTRIFFSKLEKPDFE